MSEIGSLTSHNLQRFFSYIVLCKKIRNHNFDDGLGASIGI